LSFVQRDLLAAGLDTAVVALFVPQAGEHSQQAGDVVRPSGVWRPVAAECVIPPPAGIPAAYAMQLY
jgi:hypothetical protein